MSEHDHPDAAPDSASSGADQPTPAGPAAAADTPVGPAPEAPAEAPAPERSIFYGPI